MGVVFALLPFFGDKTVPASLKVLFSISFTLVLYPMLKHTGAIRLADVAVWSSQTGPLVMTLLSEILVGLILGFASRMLFDAVQFGANLASQAMGFNMGSVYDPHFETQTQASAQLQVTLATLAFLALDGHHLLIRAVAQSYQTVGIGPVHLTEAFKNQLLMFSTQVISFGIQMAAPVVVTLFGVNVIFGVFSKALPQMNILVLSMSITAVVGLAVLFLSYPEFQAISSQVLSRSEDWMNQLLVSLKEGR
jgi:flagellar biosynthetic protein FliR